MGIVVERHQMELPEGSARVLRKVLDRLFELRAHTSVTSSQLVGAVDAAGNALAYATVVEEQGRVDDEIRAAIALGARAGAARFHAADSGPFVTTFGGPPAAVPGDGADASIHVGRFRLAWSLATLANDDEALRWLVLFPTERMAGPVDGREIRICQALQGVTEGRPTAPTLDQPALPGPPTPRAMEPLTVASEGLLRSLDHGPAPFDRALVTYLEAFRAVYARGEQRRSIHGAVTPLGLALVAVARSRGWAVEVSSPYLPLGAIGPSGG